MMYTVMFKVAEKPLLSLCVPGTLAHVDPGCHSGDAANSRDPGMCRMLICPPPLFLSLLLDSVEDLCDHDLLLGLGGSGVLEEHRLICWSGRALDVWKRSAAIIQDR